MACGIATVLDFVLAASALAQNGTVPLSLTRKSGQSRATFRDVAEPLRDEGADTFFHENQRTGALMPSAERLPEPRSERHLARPTVPAPGPLGQP